MFRSLFVIFLLQAKSSFDSNNCSSSFFVCTMAIRIRYKYILYTEPKHNVKPAKAFWLDKNKKTSKASPFISLKVLKFQCRTLIPLLLRMYHTLRYTPSYDRSRLLNQFIQRITLVILDLVRQTCACLLMAKTETKYNMILS